jgi:hypothetical protein
MRIMKSFPGFGLRNLGVLIFLAGLFMVPTPMAAQCNSSSTVKGFNVIYGNCSGSPAQQGSFAVVDASQFNSSDICLAMQSIYGISASSSNTYNPGNSNGVVIDARGYTGTLTCSVNPWVNPTYSGAGWDWTGRFSTVVLLPAGNITISKTLALPHNTKLVGQGPGLTTLVAASGFASSYTDMIDMGSSSASGYPTICGGSPQDCTGVVIEHLSLNGNDESLNGIVNHYSQELSNVNDVVLKNFSGGIGLWLSDYSNNSGPYTKISYSGSGTCVQLYSSARKISDTRGIHGLTCNISGSSLPSAVVYLDAPNNSLEDVYLSGGSSQYGILVGYQGAAYNNLLFNVQGYGLADVIHISAANSVTDLSILGLTCTGSGGTCPGNSIKDVVTGATLTDSNVGMYIVGEPVQEASSNIGYSRFTTSVNTGSTAGAVTWLVGSNAPSGSSCAPGSLYSCTNSNSCNTMSEPYTLWGCIGSSGWKHIQ